MTDVLQAHYVRKDIAKTLREDIDAWALAQWDGGFRDHMGASLIGQECSRKTWYSFHWMAKPTHSGRMQRLFQRGHLEEYRYIDYIRGIGGTILPHDPNLPLKNGEPQQWKVSKVGGHFGGSLDGIMRLPPKFGIDAWMLAEFKTKGTGSGFEKLKEKGIQLTGAQHFDQMSTYGASYNLPYAAYFSTNKNDDDMHIEIVPLDFRRAAEVEKKAAYLIGAELPPPRLSLNPTHYQCKSCEFRGVCHENKLPAKNCRSCSYARPIDGGLWYCLGHQATIPKDVIRVGCEQWSFIQSPPG